MENEFILTAKVSLIKNIFSLQVATEYIQATDSGQIGCIDNQKNWLKN